MTRKHKKHDVVDVEENRKEELLTSLTSAIESVSFKKEKIASTQIPVDRKNDDCLETLRDEKNKTLDMVRDKYDSMIRQATNQKGESRCEITSLEENLTLLNNIKIHIDAETLTPRDVKSYQETLDSIKQHTEQIPSEPRVNVYMEYSYRTDKEWLVGELCGKLQPRNYSTDSQTRNLFSVPVQQPSTGFNFGNQQPSTFQPPVFPLGSGTGFGSFTCSSGTPLAHHVKPIEQSRGLTLGSGLRLGGFGTPAKQPSICARTPLTHHVKPIEQSRGLTLGSGLRLGGFSTPAQQPSICAGMPLTHHVKPIEQSRGLTLGSGLRLGGFGTPAKQPSICAGTPLTHHVKPIEQSRGLTLGSGLRLGGFGTPAQQPSICAGTPLTHHVKPIEQSRGLTLGSGLRLGGFGTPAQQPSICAGTPLAHHVKPIEQSRGFTLGSGLRLSLAQQPSTSVFGMSPTHHVKPIEQSRGLSLGKPHEQSSGEVNETTQATSHMEIEGASASVSSQNDHVEGASPVQQAGSDSEGDEEPEGNAFGEIEETTEALSATSLAEKEEASASTSSPTDHVEGAGSVQQSGSLSESNKEPEGSLSEGIEETTETLCATSLAEKEETSASTSSPTDHVEGAGSVQQSGSLSESNKEPEGNPSEGIEETTGALSATSLAEKRGSQRFYQLTK